MAKHNKDVEKIPKQLTTLGYDDGEFTRTADVCFTNREGNETFVKEK